MATFYRILGLITGSIVTMIVVCFDTIVFFITASIEEDRATKGFDRFYRS